MAALKSAQVATLVKDAEEKRAKVRARRRVSGWTVTSSPARGPLTKLGISRLASDPPPAGLTVPPPSVRARTAVPQERTRNAQVLLLKYLRDNGYVDTAGTLTRESSAPLNDYEAASDVSLERVFEDVENHHVSARGGVPRARDAVVGERRRRAADAVRLGEARAARARASGTRGGRSAAAAEAPTTRTATARRRRREGGRRRERGRCRGQRARTRGLIHHVVVDEDVCEREGDELPRGRGCGAPARRRISASRS